MEKILPLEEIRKLVGTEIFVSEWKKVGQDQIKGSPAGDELRHRGKHILRANFKRVGRKFRQGSVVPDELRVLVR
jgi:hypothetical protein